MQISIAKLGRSILIRALLLAFVVCVVYTFWFSQVKLIKIANLKIFDGLYSLSLLSHSHEEAINDTVLISIDDESMRNLNMRWPWPRGFIAGLISKLAEHSPSVISVDLAFIGESVDREQDLVLAQVLKESKNVIVAAYFGTDGRYVVPEEVISRYVEFGYVNKPRDLDGYVRRMRPYVTSKSGKVIDYSFGVKTAGKFLGMAPEALTRNMRLLNDKTAYIRYFAKMKKINTIPVWMVLNGETDLTKLKDKMIFLGVTSELFHDIYHTPLGIMPGVVIVLNESLSYATGKFFKYSSTLTDFLILLFFVFIAVLCALRFSVLQGMFLGIIEVAVFIALSTFLLLTGIIIHYMGAIFLISVSILLLYGARYVGLVYENVMLRKEAITDGLTELYVYRYFEVSLKLELKKALEEGKGLALVIYDVDHFKKVNDKYGHEFGNKVLKTVARIMRDSSRGPDTVSRYGGEEFCILIPNVGLDDALKHTQRIWNKIKDEKFHTSGGEEVRITISAGIVTTENHPCENHLDFINAADVALYKSKNSGRDRITLFDKEEEKMRIVTSQG